MNVKSLVSLFECDENSGKVDMKVLVSPRPHIEKLIIKTPSRNDEEEHIVSRRMREMKTENSSSKESVKGKGETELHLSNELKDHTVSENNEPNEESEVTKEEIQKGEKESQRTAKEVTEMTNSTPDLGLFVLNHNLELEEPNKPGLLKILDSPLAASAELSAKETANGLPTERSTNPIPLDIPIEVSILEDGMDENSSYDSYSASLFDDYLANGEQGRSATKLRMAAKSAELELIPKTDNEEIGSQGVADAELRDKEEEEEKQEEGGSSYFSTPPTVSKDMFITPPESPTASNNSSITSPGLIYKITVKERYNRTMSLKPGFNYELPKLNSIPESKPMSELNPFRYSTPSVTSSPARPASTPPRIHTRDFQRKRIIRMEDTIDGDRDSERYSNIFHTPVKINVQPSKTVGVLKTVTKVSLYNEKLHWFNRNPFKKRKERDDQSSIPRKFVISEPQNVRDIAFEAYSKRVGVTQVHPVVKLLDTSPKKIDRAVQTEPLKVSTAFEMTRCSIQRLRDRESRRNYESKKQQLDPPTFKNEAFGEYIDTIFNL